MQVFNWITLNQIQEYNNSKIVALIQLFLIHNLIKIMLVNKQIIQLMLVTELQIKLHLVFKIIAKSPFKIFQMERHSL